MAENGLAENGPSPAASKIFSLQEVKGHATEDDCWIIVHGAGCPVSLALSYQGHTALFCCCDKS